LNKIFGLKKIIKNMKFMIENTLNILYLFAIRNRYGRLEKNPRPIWF
jgi:hypothetical protein